MTGTANGVFTRPISLVEWLQLANPSDSMMMVQLFVEGHGEIDPGELRAAVARAGDACPGSRQRRSGRRWVDSGVAPQVRVIDIGAAEPISMAHDPRFPPLRGDGGCPGAEVVLLTGDRTTTVVFRASHATMDGKGALTWATEVFRALRGATPLAATDLIDTLDLQRRVPYRVPPQRSGRVPAVLRAAERPGGKRSAAVRLAVDGQHQAVVAKIAVALRRLSDVDRMVHMIPVDLRRHQPGARATANLFSAVSLPVDASTTWPQAHQMLLSALRDNRDLANLAPPRLAGLLVRTPLGMYRSVLRSTDARLSRRREEMHSFSLTHIGRIELADFSTDGFTADALFSAPRRGMMVPPMLSIVEMDRRTELVLTVDDDPEVIAEARRLLEGVERELSPTASRLRTPGADLSGATLVSMFAAQVARTPDAIALSAGGLDVSFAELDRRATAVAAELLRRGVTRGDVVGLLAERTPGALAGMFGVLKAGAAFLPLDSHHPDARLSSLLADAGAPLCLFDIGQAGRAVVPDGCVAVALDDPPSTSTAPAPELPAVEPGDLATVIYTSGSTGRSKGVELEHRNLVNYASWAIRRHGIDSDTVFALFSSLAYLLPYTAILPPLFAGGRIALIAEEPNHVTLGRLLGGGLGVNSLKLTPSHMELISRLDMTATGIRLVVFGGERLRGPVAQRARQTFGPDCRIFNGNGITELSGACAMHEYDADADADGASVPIGRPVDNTEIVLLDANGAYAQPGEVGEMHIAGAQLARGYRDRAGLTAERFVRLADGTRVYRTGDLARVLPNGELEHVGRSDDQVKVLGHRVEPAEVAAVLERHPAVREALVVPRARSGQAAATTLCAFVAADPDVTPAELSAYLGGRLPRQLVPSAVLVLPELPRTASGKIDKMALPDPYPVAGPGEQAVPPVDELTTVVAATWAQVLGVDADDVARHGDFYLLGGDSISFLAMLAAISERLVDAADRDEFMIGMEQIIANPTLDSVTGLLRRMPTPPRTTAV